MGTRGLVGFVIDGEVKAHYNHWDSYPSGKGLDVLAFARTMSGRSGDGTVQQVRDLRKVSEDADPTDEDTARYAEYADGDVNQAIGWYSLLRRCQGDLALVLESGIILNQPEFATDSLFCEWAYLINVDDWTLEVFEGFQSEPHDLGRFAGPVDNCYYPVKLVAVYDLNDLPTDEEFTSLEDTKESEPA